MMNKAVAKLNINLTIMTTREESIIKFLELERKCRESSPLMLVGIEENFIEKYNNFEEFIIDFLLNLNYNDDIHTEAVNFPDVIQCKSGKNRSLEDIYKLVLNYYPKTSIIDLGRVLYDTVEHLSNNLYMLNCPNIQKIVFHNYKISSYLKSKFTEKLHDTDLSLGYPMMDNLYSIDYHTIR